MRSGYTDACVLCPYFIAISSPKRRPEPGSAQTWEIRCRGISEHSVISIVFSSRQEWKEHRADFCKSFCYQGCTIFQAIESGEDIPPE